MLRRDWKKYLIGIGLIVLFGLVLVCVVTFEHHPEEITIPVEEKQKEEPKKTEITFTNQSDMTEQEIRELVEQKRNDLKIFFQNAKYYTISEVGSGYQKQDDEKYIVIDEDFLNTLNDLVTKKIYNTYWMELEEISPQENIRLTKRIYKARKDLFEELYFSSAIAMKNVSEEKLLLKNATNEKIEAVENIRLLEETNKVQRDDYYRLELIKEEDTWKIDEFEAVFE